MCTLLVTRNVFKHNDIESSTNMSYLFHRKTRNPVTTTDRIKISGTTSAGTNIEDVTFSLILVVDDLFTVPRVLRFKAVGFRVVSDTLLYFTTGTD